MELFGYKLWVQRNNNAPQPRIEPHQFEMYETLILSGQIPQEEVPMLLVANVEFANWYRARMEVRKDKPVS